MQVWGRGLQYDEALVWLQFSGPYIYTKARLRGIHELVHRSSMGHGVVGCKAVAQQKNADDARA